MSSEAGPFARLAPVQIKQLQRVFYALDKDADGRVTESDVTGVLKNLGAYSALATDAGATDADAEARACFGEATDGAQSLESMAFLALMSARIGALGDARRLAEAFASFDERDEGAIDVDVLREIVDDNELVRHWLVPQFLDRSQKQFLYRKCAWERKVLTRKL